MRFQLLPELKIDMFNTSIGSCRRRRARNHFRGLFWFILVVFMIASLSTLEDENAEHA
jgi:hypothetical protein